MSSKLTIFDISPNKRNYNSQKGTCYGYSDVTLNITMNFGPDGNLVPY